MKKIILLMLVLFACTASLLAQVTREQADVIVKDYIKTKEIRPYWLYAYIYIHANAPNDEGVTVTTSNDETFKAKYACWAYYAKATTSSPILYKKKKKDNGSLVEIIAECDSYPVDADLWTDIETNTGIALVESSMNQPYPNPVKDVLTIPCNEDNVQVEIYNLYGVCLFSGMISGNGSCQLDVSFLNAGIYIVSVNGERYKVIKN
jgi:hypothetical protein